MLIMPSYSTMREVCRNDPRYFGHCFSYALAEATGETFLFKGNDFSATDIQVAVSW